ncbi:MAG: DUF3015 family protein [Deltaproteobacteria bacterium]|nr:DUF3015 family protein [Deltaproteobacteria bacterium]
MKKKVMIASLLFALTFPTVCFSAEDMTSSQEDMTSASKDMTPAPKNKTPGSGPNPFSDCGIGAALFPTIKPLAVSSNVIWDIGTTAVTSATASPETCTGKDVVAAVFILNSYESLAEETARGDGEHLAALLNILEVDKIERDAVVNNIRAQMANTVSSDTYLTADKVKKANIYYTIVIGALNNIAA